MADEDLRRKDWLEIDASTQLICVINPSGKDETTCVPGGRKHLSQRGFRRIRAG